MTFLNITGFLFFIVHNNNINYALHAITLFCSYYQHPIRFNSTVLKLLPNSLCVTHKASVFVNECTLGDFQLMTTKQNL